MSDFLNFINTADLDQLTKIPGFTRATAGNLIAARPFDFVEDCLHVKGVGKNLLGRAQSYFEAELNKPGNRALIPVQEDSAPMRENPGEKPSFWSRLRQAFNNFARSLLRLLITLAAIAIMGTVLYYGLPFISEKFMAPVEQNTVEIDRLEAEISALQSQLDEMNDRQQVLETSVEMHTASLDRLKIMQDAIDERLQENNNELLLDLKHEVMMTRVFDVLGRARLHLAQSNFGSAKEDVQSARELLAELQTGTNDEILEQVIARLDLTLGNLPEFPVVAAGDLEIAWQLLMTGKLPATPQTVPTFTLTPEPTVTP